MKLFLVLTLMISMSAFGQTSTDKIEKKDQAVENVLKPTKKDRSKKVEMCHDCGKPESQCDCEGEEHDKKD